MKNLTKIILWLLFQSLIEINYQMLPFKSKERHSPTATLIDDKLYILGGLDDPKNNRIGFYLDVSGPFNTNELPWQNLSNINAVKGGANNVIIWLAPA